MQISSKAGPQFATYEGVGGEGLGIFLSQDSLSTVRYVFDVKAKTDQGDLLVGSFVSSPPTATTPRGQPSRLVAVASCPGAQTWSVEIQALLGSNAPAEYADVVLASSIAPFGGGLQRVSERYAYRAGVGGSLPIVPGQRLLTWSAIAGAVAGSVQLGAGDVIPVPANSSVQAEPGKGLLSVQNLTFTNVDWFVEYLESA